MGIERFLCCWTGNLGKTDLLSVGEAGAEWGLEGGKGLRTITGKVLLVGDVEGVAKGVLEREGYWEASPPLCSPNNLLHPGDTGGEFGDWSGKDSLPQFGEMNGLVGGAKSKFSPDGELGREMVPGGRLSCSEEEQVTAGTEEDLSGSGICSPLLSCSDLPPPTLLSWPSGLLNWEGEYWFWLGSSFLLLQLISFNVVTTLGDCQQALPKEI